MNLQRQKLSVILPTCNEEAMVRGCLESISFADEILIIDSYSTDKTLDIVRRFRLDNGKRPKIVQHEYEYSARQKNRAIPMAQYEWILQMDADERLTDELRSEIQTLLCDPKKMIEKDGYGIARRFYFLNNWVKRGGHYPLYLVRLFRKEYRFEDRDVHAHVIVPKEKLGYLKNDILHYSYQNFEQFFEKFNVYTTRKANYAVKAMKKTRKINITEFLMNPFVFKSVVKDYMLFIPFLPLIRFIYMYIFRLGILEGRLGFLIAFLYSLDDYVAKQKFHILLSKQVSLSFFQRFRLSLGRAFTLLAQYTIVRFINVGAHPSDKEKVLANDLLAMKS